MDYVDEDGLVDPMDDGSIALAPMQFDPLCELQGTPWPKDEVEADGFAYEQARWNDSTMFGIWADYGYKAE